MIDVEAYILFLFACFFTVLYLTSGKEWLGVFGSGAWMILGFLWIFLAAAAPSYSTYAIALFFNALGIFMIAHVIVNLLNFTRNRRKLEGDID